MSIKNQTISEFLLLKIFGDCEPDLKWKIIPNEYPYYLGEYIDHLLLWIHPNYQFTLTEIDNIITSKLINTKYVKWIYFKNKQNIRSVDGIEHYHIMAHF